jgi:DNA-binding NarL/FixJ family response regulator
LGLLEGSRGYLDAQGWSHEQIAQQLTVDRATVTSYWKRVQRKLSCDRQGVREWVHQQVALAGDHQLWYG